MASMNPNPFFTPVHGSPVSSLSPAVPPLAPAVEAPLPRPTLLGPVPPPARFIPPTGFDPVPPVAPTVAPAVIAIEPRSPDVSSRVKDALLRIRRAELTRIVKGVVGVSALVCLLALGRAAFGSSSDEGATATATASQRALRAPEDAVLGSLRPQVDALSPRTLEAMNPTARTPPPRLSASRHHKRW